jgi:uncharacterized protein
VPNMVFFEICVDDLEAAASFYSRVFGWEIEREEDAEEWTITTGDEEYPGIPGSLTLRFDDWNPTVNTIDVPSIEEAAKAITEAGGKVAAPQMAVPGVGFVQYCQDPEGNAFGIMEFGEAAE